MTDIGALLVDNLHRVFGNRDAESRRRAIDELSADDVVFVDAEKSLIGADALDHKAAALLAGAPVVRGIDIVTVRDGRIVELRTALAAQD